MGEICCMGEGTQGIRCDGDVVVCGGRVESQTTLRWLPGFDSQAGCKVL